MDDDGWRGRTSNNGSSGERGERRSRRNKEIAKQEKGAAVHTTIVGDAKRMGRRGRGNELSEGEAVGGVEWWWKRKGRKEE